MNSKGYPRYRVRFYRVAQVDPERDTKVHVNFREDYDLQQNSLNKTVAYFSKST